MVAGQVQRASNGKFRTGWPSAGSPRVPEHRATLKDGGAAVGIVVELSGVRGIREVAVELSEGRLQVSGCGYALDVALPAHVDATRAAAKFSTKRCQLKIDVPVA